MDISNEAECKLANQELEELWNAPVGSLNVTRVIELSRAVEAYEKRLLPAVPAAEAAE